MTIEGEGWRPSSRRWDLAAAALAALATLATLYWYSNATGVYMNTDTTTSTDSVGTGGVTMTSGTGQQGDEVSVPVPPQCRFIASDVPYMRYPKQYIAYQVGGSADSAGMETRSSYEHSSPPVIDGKLDDPAWSEVGWSEDFQDILGNDNDDDAAAAKATTKSKATVKGATPPRFRTRVKMRWDARWLYVAAELEEPQVWANLTVKNSVIFNDNDFEVFIDVDGSTHGMVEHTFLSCFPFYALRLPLAFPSLPFPSIDSAIHGEA